MTSLSRHPLLWRCTQASHQVQTLASGHPGLDAALPGHGWPMGAITELLHKPPGCGELSLLLPALAHLGQDKHRIIMIDPPWIPYPPALYSRGLALENLLLIRTQNRNESLWACEQVLRGIPGGAMLAWPEHLSFSELRRLQLAAKSGNKAVFLFRNASMASDSSPAVLRLRLTADDGDLQIRVLKCRGHRPASSIHIRRSQLLQAPMPPFVGSGGSSRRSGSSAERSVVSMPTSQTISGRL